MENTHFVNPSGLDAEGHHSSAEDLVDIGRAVMDHPELARMMRLKSAVLPGSPLRVVTGTNKLLSQVPGAFGLKTGDTPAAGLVLVAGAERNGRRLYTVVMGSADHFADAGDVARVRVRRLDPLGAGEPPRTGALLLPRRHHGPVPDHDNSPDRHTAAPRRSPGRYLHCSTRWDGWDASSVTTDDTLVEVIPESVARSRIAELGRSSPSAYADRSPVLVAVLQGALPFVADLIRSMDIELEVDFLALTRFGEGGRVRIAMDTETSLEGRHVLLVEDVVDTGLSLTVLRRLIAARDVASLATVTLFDKAVRRIVEVPLEYRGFEVGDEFLLGYGLDWEGRFRNLGSVWAVLDLVTFQFEPQRFASRLFRPPVITCPNERVTPTTASRWSSWG